MVHEVFEPEATGPSLNLLSSRFRLRKRYLEGDSDWHCNEVICFLAPPRNVPLSAVVPVEDMIRSPRRAMPRPEKEVVLLNSTISFTDAFQKIPRYISSLQAFLQSANILLSPGIPSDLCEGRTLCKRVLERFLQAIHAWTLTLAQGLFQVKNRTPPVDFH